MAILTLADFKAMAGVSGTTNDALYTRLLASMQDAVERYCDRKFDAANYQQWFAPQVRMRVHEFPVTQVRGVGSLEKCASLAFASGQYTVSSSDKQLTVTDYATMISTDFTWAVSATLSALKTAVEAAYPAVATVTVVSGYASYATSRVRSALGYDIYMAVPYATTLRAQVDPETMTYVTVDPIPSGSGTFPFAETVWIAYRAGYAYADMPKGLQQALAGIVKETAAVLLLSGAGAIKSESVTNYRYDLFENRQVSNIIESYSGALEDYRRKPVFDAE